MTGRKGWRLLAALSLIFVAIFAANFAAPEFLRGQNGDQSPVLAPNLSELRYSAPNVTPRLPVVPKPPPRDPVAPGSLVFQQLVRAAGIIFAGRVTSIRHGGSPSGQTSLPTMVTFHVEHAIRGTAPGLDLTIREWAGLRTGGDRYRVGEHVMLFLYSPGKLGLTSPVAGSLGKFQMDFEDRIVLDPQHAQVLGVHPTLGGKTAVPYLDFARAVRRSSPEE